MENNSSFEKRNLNGIVLFSIVTILYIALRVLKFGESDLWTDEVFSVLTIRQSWAAMFSSVVSDAVHPPLFYILLKIWAAANASVFWLRLFPLTISILTLIPLYLFCRSVKLNLSETAVVFLLIAVNGFFLEYALDLRMYGLVQFLTLFSLWTFVKLQGSKAVRWKIVIILAAVNLLLVYTHYFGWLVVGAEGLYLLIWQRRFFYSFAVGCAAVALGFAPWVWLVATVTTRGGSTGNLAWLTPPTLADLTWFYSTLDGNLNFPHTTFINLAIFTFPIVWLLWNAMRREKIDFDWRLLTATAFAPTLFVFVVSHLLPKSVWNDRYLIIVAVPYCVLFVKAAFALPNKTLRGVFVSAILIWSLVAGFGNYTQPPKKIQWSEAARKIKTEANAAENIYAFESFVSAPLQFYLDEQGAAIQVKKASEPSFITDRSFFMVRRVSEPNFKSDLPNGCREVERNFYPGGEQGVLILKIDACPTNNF